MYYFTTNNKNHVDSHIESYINPIYLETGDVKLEITKLQIKNLSGNLKEFKDITLNYQVFISKNRSDLSFMSSLCSLSKIDRLPDGIVSYIKDNEIYLSRLKKGQKYFCNVLIKNPISGELIIFTPTIIEVNYNFKSYGIYLAILIFIIVILVIIIIYYRKKYLNSKAVLNYEQNDIRNMDNLSSDKNEKYRSSISQGSKNTTRYINLEESKI